MIASPGRLPSPTAINSISQFIWSRCVHMEPPFSNTGAYGYVSLPKAIPLELLRRCAVDDQMPSRLERLDHREGACASVKPAAEDPWSVEQSAAECARARDPCVK